MSAVGAFVLGVDACVAAAAVAEGVDSVLHVELLLLLLLLLLWT